MVLIFFLHHARNITSIYNQSKKVKEDGVTLTCAVCKQGMPNIGAMRNHYENKHAKLPLPPELVP